MFVDTGKLPDQMVCWSRYPVFGNFAILIMTEFQTCHLTDTPGLAHPTVQFVHSNQQAGKSQSNPTSSATSPLQRFFSKTCCYSSTQPSVRKEVTNCSCPATDHVHSATHRVSPQVVAGLVWEQIIWRGLPDGFCHQNYRRCLQ